MPGKPKEARLLAALAKRALSEIGEDATPLDFVCQYVAGGKTSSTSPLRWLLNYKSPSRGSLSRVQQMRSAPTRKSGSRPLAREGAAALVEEAVQIADDAEPTTGAVQKARLHVGTRQWTAERWAPDLFGQKGALVNVSIGQLMLEALMQPPPPNPFIEVSIQSPALAAVTDAAEYETLSD